MDPALQELLASTRPDETREVIVRLRDPRRVPTVLHCVSRFGAVVTGRVRAGAIPQLHAHPLVASVKAPRSTGAEPPPTETLARSAGPAMRPAQPAPGAHTGRGCLIGVVDFGIDWAHPVFRTRSRTPSRAAAAATSRIEAIWDQHEWDPRRTGSIERFGYGRCFTGSDFQRALAQPRPYEVLDYHPAARSAFGDGHGTQVLGIAASAAPGATLAAVELAASAGGPGVGLGDSSRLLEAIDWLDSLAGERPCVVSVSLGAMAGPHDGTSLVEMAIDARIRARPNLSVVCSAGNYRRDRAHVAGGVRSGRPATLSWSVPTRDRSANEIEIWYAGEDEMLLELRPPEGPVRRIPLGSMATLRVGARSVGRAYHRRREPNSRDHMIEVWLDREAPTGTWQILLHAVRTTVGRFDAWIERDPAGPENQSSFEGAVVETGTLGSIATGCQTVVVGALDESGEPASWSSLGPTRDGRDLPTLWMPGTNVLAPAATPRGSSVPGARYTRISGTSAAAPQAAARLACLHDELGPRADGRRVREWLRSGAGRDHTVARNG